MRCSRALKAPQAMIPATGSVAVSTTTKNQVRSDRLRAERGMRRIVRWRPTYSTSLAPAAGPRPSHLLTLRRATGRIHREEGIMRLIKTVVGLGVAGALLAGAALPAAADGEIKAGSITNSPPMISYASDGTTLQGAIVDLAEAMSRKMGRRIVFESIAFKGLLPAMEAKRIDITFTLMNDTPEREKLIDFVDFVNLGTMLLVKKGNPEHITSLESACGKTVSTVQGSTQV